MRLNRPSVLGLILLLKAPVCSGCFYQRHQKGWSDALGTRIAKTDRESEAFRRSLAEWLSTHGFTAASAPGGTASWSGVHSVGEINSWYRGTYHDSPSFLLCVRIVPRKDVGGGFMEFHFTQVWDIAGGDRYVAEMEALSKEFKTELKKGLSLEKDDQRGP
jgi:hypothetical protein